MSEKLVQSQGRENTRARYRPMTSRRHSSWQVAIGAHAVASRHEAPSGYVGWAWKGECGGWCHPLHITLHSAMLLLYPGVAVRLQMDVAAMEMRGHTVSAQFRDKTNRAS